MIPKSGGSKYPEWLPNVVGMEVKILTEPVPSDNEKLQKPFYCTVEYKGTKYSLGFNMSAYYTISKNDSFGDMKNWVGGTIKYLGLQPIKTKKGVVKGHMWEAMTKEINLDSEETPF